MTSDFTDAFAALVDDGERRADAFWRARAARTTTPPTSGDTTITLVRVEAFADIAHHHRRGVEIVGRDVEEALDLSGVQIERHDAIGRRHG